MERRSFLKGLAGGIAGAATFPVLGGQWAGGMTSDPDHIVMLVFDDAEWPDFGFTAPTDIDTPRLNAVRASGAFFTNYYSMSGCTPSRYGLIGGSNPIRWGVRGAEGDNKTMDPVATTGNGLGGVSAVHAIKAAGYRTGIIGKYHVGLGRDDAWPDKLGFDCAQIKTGGSGPANGVGSFTLTGADRADTTYSGVDYVDLLYADRAVEFVTQAEANNEKSFLSVNWHTPHVDWDLGDPSLNVNGYDLSTGRGQKQAAMKLCDVQIGRVLDAYDDLSKVLVLILSDNGAPSDEKAEEGAQGPNDHQRGYKTDMYEGGVNVPLVAAWPAGGIVAGSTHTGQICAWDLLGSVASELGQSHSGRGYEDRSAALFHGDPTNRAPWVIETASGINNRGEWREYRQLVVFDWPMKYVQGSKELSPVPWELYDIDADPSEQNPLPVTPAEHEAWLALAHSLRADICAQPLGAWSNETDPNCRPWTLRLQLDGSVNKTYVNRNQHLRIKTTNKHTNVDFYHRDEDGSGPHRRRVKIRNTLSGQLMISVLGIKRGYPIVSVFHEGDLVEEITDMHGMWQNTKKWKSVDPSVQYYSCEFRPGELP